MNTINFNDDNIQWPHVISDCIYDFYGSGCPIHGHNLSFFPFYSFFKGPKGDDGPVVS